MDETNLKLPGYTRHLFICGHERQEGSARPHCQGRGSLDILSKLKMLTREAGINNVRVQKSGCLDYCEQGISCVVYPEGVWYSLKDDTNLLDLVEHLQSGTIAEQLRMQIDN
jgi:(2Fe-2S) ferredoxin